MTRASQRKLIVAGVLLGAAVIVYIATRTDSSAGTTASPARSAASPATPTAGGTAAGGIVDPASDDPDAAAFNAHMADKRARMAELARMRVAAASSADDGVDYDEPRPEDPQEMGNPESKREKEIGAAQRVVQTERALLRIRERAKRTKERADAARSSGDAAEAERLDAIAARLEKRATKLQEIADHWRTEAAAASASGSPATPPDP